MDSKRFRVIQRRQCFYVERRGWEHQRLFMSLETAKKYIAERIRIEGAVVYERRFDCVEERDR